MQPKIEDRWENPPRWTKQSIELSLANHIRETIHGLNPDCDAQCDLVSCIERFLMNHFGAEFPDEIH